MLQDGSQYAQRTGRGRRQAINGTPTQSTSITQVTSSYSSSTPGITSSPTTGSVQNQSSYGQAVTDGEPPAEVLCTVALPSGGIIQFNDSTSLRLEDTVSFQGECANNSIFDSATDHSIVIPFNDPFYASIAPQVYVLAATTIISYLLVIILFITPRTFYIGGPAGSGTSLGGSSGFLGRGMTFMGNGSSTSGAVGIGRRPLLQKIATITVAISLTIATSDTFDVAASQYRQGFMDASTLVRDVVGSDEIRVTRVISDAFLWLAQVQTLIRLFPRHKEKVTIKWLGFGLVTCDTVFSILENFVSKSNRTRPESFRDAIPALSYLFELSISLIYASCVVYYALSKRRFAFWHPRMMNVCLVALMSLTAILIPVVFFIVDVAQPEIATWGEYIRWVGAAAASVVVWEWVERIEALERDERKDGILGREIFDGDEMIDLSHSGDHDFDHGSDLYGSDPKGGDTKEKGRTMNKIRGLNVRPRIPFKMRRKGVNEAKPPRRNSIAAINGVIIRPPQAATPISRSDTNSAASTVYAVRYHNVLSPSPAIPENAVVHIEPQEVDPAKEIANETIPSNMNTITEQEESNSIDQRTHAESVREHPGNRHVWHHVANPFKRKRAEPPAEVAAQIAESNLRRSPADRPLNLKTRFNAFATTQRERFGGRSKNRTPLQVTVIPAQPRGSRAEVTDDSVAGSLVENDEEIHPERPTAILDEGDTTPRQASLPITVIPAPVKGGRTWSPDDMIDVTSQNRQGSDSSSSSNARSRSANHRKSSGTAPKPVMESLRATPPVRSSPGRSTNSPGGRSFLRASDFSRNRAATTMSMNERMNGSPSNISGGTSSESPSNSREYGTPGEAFPSPPAIIQGVSNVTSSSDPRSEITRIEHLEQSTDARLQGQGHAIQQPPPNIEGQLPNPSRSGPGRP